MAEVNRALILRAKVYDVMFRRFEKCHYPILISHLKYQAHFSGDHFHDFPQMWYCISGMYTHTVGAESFTCGPGSVVIVPSGVFHGVQISGENPTELIRMDGSFFFFFDKKRETVQTNTITNLFCPQFGDELGFTLPRFVTLPESERARAEGILLSLCKINYKGNVSNCSEIRRKIEAFFSLPTFALTDAQKRTAEAFIRSKLSPMMDTVSYMNKNYAKKIHREELISISTLCQTDFFRFIKKIVGTTYARYLQMIRLRRVQMMISFSTFSFSYIADNCGFGSWRYLSRLFKQHFGKTMQEERKNRNALVKIYPGMIMTREFWEKMNFE